MKYYTLDIELTERIQAHVHRNAQARKRTAARLWVMRRQLREAEGGICVIGCYSLDVQERREAVQKVRDEVKP